MGWSRKTGGGGYGRSRPFRLLFAAVCASTVAAFAGTAGATTGSHLLTSHLRKTPPAVGARRATGALTARLSIAGQNGSFTWKLAFAHLSGRALHAGIYFGKTAKPSQLAMLLCTECSPTAQGYYHGPYVAGKRFVRAMLRGRAYVVVQTRRNPKGEISGRIKVKAT